MNYKDNLLSIKTNNKNIINNLIKQIEIINNIEKGIEININKIMEKSKKNHIQLNENKDLYNKIINNLL